MVTAASQGARHVPHASADESEVCAAEVKPLEVIGDSEVRTFDRAVSFGNLLAALTAAVAPIVILLVLNLMANASDKATMQERVEQYHKATELAISQANENIKSQAARTDALSEQENRNHLEIMVGLGKGEQKVEDLYSFLRQTSPGKGH